MATVEWEPDYRNVVEAAYNRRPKRLPLYEHSIHPAIMGKILGVKMTDWPAAGASRDELRDFFSAYTRFWREMTYDTVSFEGGICDILPEHGAILGGRPGPIQNRDDFKRYPWAELPRLYWDTYGPRFEALAAAMPPGMKALGGCGYGIFEISEDLVGYEHLCMLQFDDPDLFAELYTRIGDLVINLWTELLRRHGDLFAVCRMGDDLGYKTSMLLRPETVIQHVVPQYRRLVQLVHSAGKPFLLHSCGCIFPVMEAVIEAGINAKHSNEDVIAPFSRWIKDYAPRIGLFGGFDVDLLCREKPQQVFGTVVAQGAQFRAEARGYALGSGNSIPNYVPVEGYLAMVEGAKRLREKEAA
jgi:uroporphyrinogen decarboxylase